MNDLSPRSQKKFQSIIDHSSKLFVKYGYRKVTMDSIASEAGVSKVTLYKYFKDKQVLYEYILEMNYRKELEALTTISKSELSFKEKMHQMLDLRLNKFHEKNIPLYKDEFPPSIQLSTYIESYREKMHQIRKDLFNQGRSEGAIKRDVSDQTLTLYFLIVERGLNNSKSLLSETDKKSLEDLFSLLFTGIFQ